MGQEMTFNIIIMLVKKYWKVALPVVHGAVIVITFVYQNGRIKSLKEERNVAIYEHDRAVEEVSQLLEDTRRLNTILVGRRAKVSSLEASLHSAMGRISSLSQERSDIADWVDTRIPDGMWAEIFGDGEEGSSPRDTSSQE